MNPISMEASMTRQSQALEELFGIKAVFATKGGNRGGSGFSNSTNADDLSPGEASHSPEVFSELCR